MMKNMEINEILKEQRLKEKITLEKIFYEIHIPSKFVRMIEDGNWDKFPSPLHMKGFLRIYGQYLNIPASVLEEGIRSIEKQQKEAEEQEEEKEKEKKEKFEFPKRCFCLLLLLILFFMILYFGALYLLPE